MKGIDFALKMIGLDENHNTTEIMNFLHDGSVNNDILVDPSKTPWCAAFINSCERHAGKAGTGKLNARSFLDYGVPVRHDDVQVGDIVVFSRGNNTWEGHVTYFDGWYNDDQTMMKCLGGNQTNEGKICIEIFNTERVLGVRRS